MQQPHIEITLTFTSCMGDHKVTTTGTLNIDDVPIKLGTYARLRHGHLVAARAAARTSRPSLPGGEEV